MEKFNFKKRYGQNFIKNPIIVEKIVEKSQIPEDTLILEVGVGKGILTNELIKHGKQVISYEIDTTLKDYLDEKFNNANNLEIIYTDFMERDIIEDINKYEYKNIYFIANVPYYITTPILMKLMNLNVNVDKIVMMVQKEVGERFNAMPKTKEYSSLTVLLNYYYDIKKLLNVNKNEFIPVPKVDSVVIALTRKKELLEVKNYDIFYKLIRDSFQFKRKTLRNNLRGYDLTKIEEILIKNNLSLSSRAEEISVDVFVQMSNYLS